MDATSEQLVEFQTHGQDIPYLLGHWATARPEHPALVWQPRDDHQARTWTYRELLTDVKRLAAGLAGRGITRGDKVEERPVGDPEHVHQPLIQTIIDELNGKGVCPSTGESGARTAKVMDAILADFRTEP